MVSSPSWLGEETPRSDNSHDPVHTRGTSERSRWFNELQRISTLAAERSAVLREFRDIDVTDALAPEVSCRRWCCTPPTTARVPFEEAACSRASFPAPALCRSRPHHSCSRTNRAAALARGSTRFSAGGIRRRFGLRRIDRTRAGLLELIAQGGTTPRSQRPCIDDKTVLTTSPASSPSSKSRIARRRSPRPRRRLRQKRFVYPVPHALWGASPDIRPRGRTFPRRVGRGLITRGAPSPTMRSRRQSATECYPVQLDQHETNHERHATADRHQAHANASNFQRHKLDIDRDVIRGRKFDFRRSPARRDLPVDRLDFLKARWRRLLSQVQGRTYANIFAGERYSAKIGNQPRSLAGRSDRTRALVRFTGEELKHQELFRQSSAVAEGMPQATRSCRSQRRCLVRARKVPWAVLALTCHIELFTQCITARVSNRREPVRAV